MLHACCAASCHACVAVCLVVTQLYHAWNQLRALQVPMSSWPGVIASVIAELLAANPVRGRIMLGAAMWALQVLLLELQAEFRGRARSRAKQVLALVEGVDMCTAAHMSGA